MPATHKSLRQKWRRWLKRIERDVLDLVIAQHIYEGIGTIVLSNPAIQQPSDVHSWMSRNYGIATVIGIRRLTDTDPRSVSLARLLLDLAANPNAVTRESHVCRYRLDLRGAGEHWFDEFAGKGENTLPPKVPSRHLRQLTEAERRIRQLVNKRIAHLDQRNVRRKPVQFQEIHDVIRVIERTVIEYKLLLEGASPQPSLLPTWLYDWWEVFYQPWVKSPPVDLQVILMEKAAAQRAR